MHGIGTSANTPSDHGVVTEPPENKPNAAAFIVTAGVFVLSLAFFVACIGVLIHAVAWAW